MKTSNGFYRDCILQSLSLLPQSWADSSQSNLPPAWCSPRIACIFPLSRVYHSIAHHHEKQAVVRIPLPCPKTILLPFFFATIKKNPTKQNASTSMQACTHTLKEQEIKADVKVKRKDDGSVLSRPRWAAKAFAVIYNKATLKMVYRKGDGMIQENSTGLQMISGRVSWAMYFHFFYWTYVTCQDIRQQHMELNVH